MTAQRYRGNINRQPKSFSTKDGVSLRMRLLCPDDADLLQDLFQRLSPESKRRRFHADVDRLDPERIRQAAQQLADVDNRTQGGAVLALHDAAGGEAVVGIARLARPLNQPHSPMAEAAITVRDDFQGRGVGSELLRRLVLLAKQMRVEVMLAEIESDNSGAIHLFSSLDLPTETKVDHGTVVMRIAMPTS